MNLFSFKLHFTKYESKAMLPMTACQSAKKIKEFFGCIFSSWTWDDTKRMGVSLVVSLCYGLFFPIHLIYFSLKLLVYGNEKMTEREKLNLFVIKFREGITESLPQLMLSIYVILQHCLKDWIQVASIFGSSISLLYNFSMKFAYLKHLHYPTNMEIFIVNFLFNKCFKYNFHYFRGYF